MGFPSGSDDKESACNTEVMSLIPGSGRSPGEGDGYPLQYSCLENSMDRGAWLATLHGVAKSWTRLSSYYFHFLEAEQLLALNRVRNCGGGNTIVPLRAGVSMIFR